ncbi:hypothetical protein [Microbacterium sp. Se63.02b]|uniref:hypothetical protein n=1 Tax=Microbacterium sp. Se63.02b TaxID=2709304 RepID=UPI001FCEBFE2|nr:hypothetical protein [Microbacterium sp. Se63.02b]
MVDAPRAPRIGAGRHEPSRPDAVQPARRRTRRRDASLGVLDGGGFGPADRALDLVAAWHVFDAPARQVLRDEVGAGEIEWRRGAAWAFQQAIGLGWYYEESNPEMSALGLSTLRRILADPELSSLV